MSPKAGMRRAGDVLTGIIEGLKLGPRLAGWKAVNAWDEIAGSEHGGHTRALRFERGRLVVQVDSSARMAQLGLEKPELMKKIDAKVGPGVVRKLIFVIAGRSIGEEET